MVEEAMNHAAHLRLSVYAHDLNHRIKLRDEWRTRHPDERTALFILDSIAHERGEPTSGETTFNPDDPMPTTSDVITAERFADIINLLLSISTND
jgi:hypothetical protein